MRYSDAVPGDVPLVPNELPGEFPAPPTTGTIDDDDEPEDESESENEAPERATNELTEAPEEFDVSGPSAAGPESDHDFDVAERYGLK